MLRKHKPGAESSLKTQPRPKKKTVPAVSVLNLQECYVSRVISFSTQYNTSGWSANQVIGEPKVYPRYGDIQGSWASRSCTANEFLEVEFPKDLFIHKISLFETYNGGAVTSIGAWNPLTNSYVSLYHAAPKVIAQSRIFEPQIEVLNFKCNRLRVDIDCTAAGTWCEIDAIKISGLEHNLPPPPPNSLSDDMLKLVNSNTFSDICFIIEKKKVPAHKAILVTRSDYFNAMFNSSMKESNMDEIVLENVDYETFIPMLEYMYTGKLSCSPVVAVNMLKLADMFGMEDLKLTCMSRVPEHLSIDTVLGVLNAVSEGDSLHAIRELCYDFIAKNFDQVTNSEEFKSLNKDQILQIVQITASKLKL